MANLIEQAKQNADALLQQAYLAIEVILYHLIVLGMLGRFLL